MKKINSETQNTEDVAPRKDEKGSLFMKITSIFLRVIFLLLIVGIGLGAGFTAGMYSHYASQIPDLDSILTHKPALITNCYDRNGDVFARFYVEKREVVPLQNINTILKEATLATEDLRFYQHKGIDFLGILRAMRTNIAAGRIVQGASTITMQLSRSLFLSRERKFSRKIKEAIISLKIEQMLTKSQILELYFNEIYFGHGCYGVQAASKTFFGKDNRDLTLAECSLLAGLPNLPNVYSPYLHPSNAIARRKVVLTRMLNAGFISAEQMKIAAETPLELVPLERRRGQSPYFEEHIRQIIEAKFGSNAVHRGGLKVETTLDQEIQHSAQRALKWGLHEYCRRKSYKGPLQPEQKVVIDQGFPAPDLYGTGTVIDVTDERIKLKVDDFDGVIEWHNNHWTGVKKPSSILKKDDIVFISIREDNFDREKKTLEAELEQYPEVEGGVVVLEAKTGDILALVGGYSFERSQFNRATQAIRQPGSSFKPIVYSVAFDNSFTASNIIYDAPIVEEIIKADSEDEEENDTVKQAEDKPEMWKPENYDETFLGPTTLRNALEKSRNLITIRLLQKLGVRQVSRYARAYGITTNIEEDLSMALGSSGVIPLELTSVYGMIARGGVKTKPREITHVYDNSGHVIWENLVTEHRVLDQRIAFLVSYLMQGVIESGTGQRAKILNRPMAGKTGTTNEFKDAWFVGFTPDVVVGVWVGFDQVQSLGKKESGALAALPIWIKVMGKLLSRYDYKTFEVPPGIEFALVDKDNGLLATKQSENIIREAYLEGRAPVEFSNDKYNENVHSTDMNINLLRMEEISRQEENPSQIEQSQGQTDEYPEFD